MIEIWILYFIRNLWNKLLDSTLGKLEYYEEPIK